MAFHNFSSSSMHSPHATFSNASVPTGVLRIFTSGGKSHSWACTLMLGSTPACFQCGIESPLPPNEQVMDCSCAFGHADHAHVIEEREEVLSWQRNSLHFAQRTEETSTGPHVASLVLRHLPTGTVLIFPRITCRNCVDGSDKRNQPMELWDFHQLGQHRNQDVVINTDSVN